MGNRSSLTAVVAYALIVSLPYVHTATSFFPKSYPIRNEGLLWKPVCVWTTKNKVAADDSSCRRTQPRRGIRWLSLALNNSNKKHLSASERERWDEEKRRKDRQGEVVIGKTSARPGEKDFPLDPITTENDYLRQASYVEQEVFRQTERGMEMLKMLRLDEASQAFDRVFELRPNAYLWQAGIAKYYLNDLQGAADIFARCAMVFESKFGSPASEERIWRDACELKLLHSLGKKERRELEEGNKPSGLVAAIPERGAEAELLHAESRKVIRITRQLFSSSVERDLSTMVLSRAKLRSIGGNFMDRPALPDRKMWKLNSWYYLGLHYDALSELDESKECMKMALSLCPSSGNANDIIHTLPLLHMSKRDWFDDFDMSLNPLKRLGSITSLDTNLSCWGVDTSTWMTMDPLIVISICESISKMRTVDLKSALQERGLKIEGSKEQLQGKLFKSLLNDDELQQGW